MIIILFWRKEERYYVPIIGNPGVGKTSFIVSMGKLVSDVGWGFPCGSPREVAYFYEVLSLVSQGKPIPPTRGFKKIKICINKVAYRGDVIETNLLLSSGDISGQDYNLAIDWLSVHDVEEVAGAPPVISRFINLIEKADLIIPILDITRSLNEDDVDLESALIKEIGRHLYAVATGVEYICHISRKTIKGVFFVFNKADIHRLTVKDIRRIFEDVFAILIARLRHSGIEWRVYTTVSIHWGKNPVETLKSRGFNKLLYDLVATLSGYTLDTQTNIY